MKHLRNSNGNTEQESVLANKDSCKEFDIDFRVLEARLNLFKGFSKLKEFDIDFRVLEARLNLFKGFSKLTEQLGINVIDVVPFFKTKAPHN